MGAARGTEASLAEATYGTDHLASLHVYLGQRTGIGEIHVFHLVIHTNSLHMGVATAQVDGIIVGIAIFQGDFPHLFDLVFWQFNGRR